MDPYIAEVVKLLDKNKALAAFLWPFVATVLGTVAHWLIWGDTFDWTEIRIALGGLVLSTASAIGTYLARSGKAVVNAVPPAVQEPSKIFEP